MAFKPTRRKRSRVPHGCADYCMERSRLRGSSEEAKASGCLKTEAAIERSPS
jgi:hypothetical protein